MHTGWNSPLCHPVTLIRSRPKQKICMYVTFHGRAPPFPWIRRSVPLAHLPPPTRLGTGLHLSRRPMWERSLRSHPWRRHPCCTNGGGMGCHVQSPRQRSRLFLDLGAAWRPACRELQCSHPWSGRNSRAEPMLPPQSYPPSTSPSRQHLQGQLWWRRERLELLLCQTLSFCRADSKLWGYHCMENAGCEWVRPLR